MGFLQTLFSMHRQACFVMFYFCVGFMNRFWKRTLGIGGLTVETCSWFSPYWLRGELTRWLSKFPPTQILNCKALMMTALLISLNLISITLYKEILSKAKLSIDLHCVWATPHFVLIHLIASNIFWTSIRIWTNQTFHLVSKFIIRFL